MSGLSLGINVDGKLCTKIKIIISIKIYSQWQQQVNILHSIVYYILHQKILCINVLIKQ